MPVTRLQRLSGYLAAVLAAALMLALLSAAHAEQSGSHESPIMVPNPATDLWRAVRQREVSGQGTTQARGVETGVLINRAGEDFRNFRRQDFISNAAIFIAAFAALVLVFYVTRGCIKIPGGRSGRRIQRFPDFDRTVHWFTAILFIFQALTGMILLFGRFVVLPVFGPEAFSIIASACLQGHNLFGPVFLAAIILLFVRFAAKNIPTRHDITWIKRGGGAVGEGHVSAGFFNAGEKVWFWAVIGLGITVSVSGMILLFPNFAQGREIMQIALIVHGIAAVLFIGGSFGHIYIGTIGSEGSLESMTTGYVDENWAEAHHDLWYAEAKRLGDKGISRPEHAGRQAQNLPPTSADEAKA